MCIDPCMIIYIFYWNGMSNKNLDTLSITHTRYTRIICVTFVIDCIDLWPQEQHRHVKTFYFGFLF